MSFREINVLALTPAEMADQPRPMLEWVAIDRMVIDDRYQRAMDAKGLQAVQRIADAFEWAKFSPVLLAPADGGRLAVIDGQHRVHAAKLCGLHAVPAQIVHLSVAAQAAAFVGVNTQVKQMTVHQIYRAALAGGEGWAVRCRDVVEGAGCHLATSNPSAVKRKAGVIYCIGAVRKMITGGQAKALSAALKAIRAYDTTGRVALYSDYILTPFVRAVASDAAFLRADLAGFLRANDPFRLIGRAEKMRAGGAALTNADAIAMAIRAFQKGAA